MCHILEHTGVCCGVLKKCVTSLSTSVSIGVYWKKVSHPWAHYCLLKCTEEMCHNHASLSTLLSMSVYWRNVSQPRILEHLIIYVCVLKKCVTTTHPWAHRCLLRCTEEMSQPSILEHIVVCCGVLKKCVTPTSSLELTNVYCWKTVT